MKSRCTPTRWAPNSSVPATAKHSRPLTPTAARRCAEPEGQRLAEPPGVDEQDGPADAPRDQQPAAATAAAWCRTPARRRGRGGRRWHQRRRRPAEPEQAEPDPQRDQADPAVAGDQLRGPGSDQGHHHQRQRATEPHSGGALGMHGTGHRAPFCWGRKQGPRQYHQSHASHRGTTRRRAPQSASRPSSISCFLASRWARRISASRIRRSSSGVSGSSGGTGRGRPSTSIATNTKYADATCSGSRRRVVPRLRLDPDADLHRGAAGPVDLAEGAHDVADVHRLEERHLVERGGHGRAALCRWATAPAVESASLTISPPWMLPSRLASLPDVIIASETRAYDGGVADEVGHGPHGSVSRHGRSSRARRSRGRARLQLAVRRQGPRRRAPTPPGPIRASPDAPTTIPGACRAQPRPAARRAQPARPTPPPVAPPPGTDRRGAGVAAAAVPPAQVLDPHRARAAPALGRLPRRGAALRLDEGRQGRRSSPTATGPATSPARRT